MSSSTLVSKVQNIEKVAPVLPEIKKTEKQGYLTGLLRNIENEFYKDPYRTKMHEQIIGSLIFWFVYTAFIFLPLVHNKETPGFDFRNVVLLTEWKWNQWWVQRIPENCDT